MRDDARVDDHLYLFVPGVGQIRQSPHGVDQDLQGTKNSPLFSSRMYEPRGLYQTVSKTQIRRFTHADVSVIYQHTERRQDLRKEHA